MQRQHYGDAVGENGEETEAEGFLTEDEDDDRILDDGEDANGNGVLNVGVDADDDGTLNDEEIVAEDQGMTSLPPRPTVYTAEGEIDSGFEPLLDQQNVIAVHQSSDQYETIVACGNVGGIEYEDGNEIVIGLTSVDGSQVRGYAVFEYDTAVLGNDVTAVTVHVFENIPSQRDARMAATPAGVAPCKQAVPAPSHDGIDGGMLSWVDTVGEAKMYLLTKPRAACAASTLLLAVLAGSSATTAGHRPRTRPSDCGH